MDTQFTAERAKSILLWCIGLAVLGFGTYRASALSFTHDESMSFLKYTSSSTWDLLTLKDVYTNNHVLNSIGMKWSNHMFGPSELALRLPNLILLVVHLFYTALLVRPLPLLAAVASYILLCCNISLLDLMTLARGYGLSIGFMSMAIFHLIASLRTRSAMHTVLFHSACILAVFSNFTMVDVYTAAVGLVVLFTFVLYKGWSTAKGSTFHYVRTHALMLGIALVVLATPVYRVASGNSFDFGGKTDFYDSTIRYLIYRVLAGLSVLPEQLGPLQVLFTVITAIAVGMSFRSIRKIAGQHERSVPSLAVVTGLFVLISAASIAQHLLLGTDFLQNRFAMFMVPLFLLMIVFLVIELCKGRSPWVAGAMMMVLTCPTVLGFARLAFPLGGSEWNYDVQTKDAMVLLSHDHLANTSDDRDVHIGSSWVFEPTINFYRTKMSLTWLAEAHRDGLTEEDDYRLLLLEVMQAKDTAGYSVVGSFDQARTLLLRRNKPAQPMN